MEAEHIQPVEQIFTEKLLSHQLFQVPVGGGDDPHVDGDDLGAAQPDNIFFLEHTEKTPLIGIVHLRDLVQKQSPAVGRLKDAGFPLLGCSGERLSLIHIYSEQSKNLLTLCVVNSLERCSYTTKTGQYLGWDYRSPKVIKANKEREASGKKLLPKKVVREVIADAHELITEELEHVITEIKLIQNNNMEANTAHINYVQNTVLKELPLLEDNSINGVITSPPYCNRYDYTRTYALELVYLGLGEQGIKDMRQTLISCTVESKSKVEQLEEYYKSIGEEDRFINIKNIIDNNNVLNEVKNALNKRKDNGDLNNNGVIRMVEGYFTELAFVYAEIYRACVPGSFVAFVNDNVRYGGEVIPVDFLSSLFAEQFGFKVKKVYCLHQKKGNSSQQMAKFGKVSLRKSITIWEKE